MPARRMWSLPNRDLHHKNVKAARGAARDVIRLAKSLHASLYQANVRARQLAVDVFGPQDPLLYNRNDSLDKLLSESRDIGNQFASPRPIDMTPVQLGKHHRNLSALAGYLKQSSDDAAALSKHWSDIHVLMQQLVNLYQ